MNSEPGNRGRVSGAMVVRVYVGSMIGAAVVAMMANPMHAPAMPGLLLGFGMGAVLGRLGWRYLVSLLAAYAGFRLAFRAAARASEPSLLAILLSTGGGYGGCLLVLSVRSWLDRRRRKDAARSASSAESEFSTCVSISSTPHTHHSSQR
jgi:hypothetical protein